MRKPIVLTERIEKNGRVVSRETKRFSKLKFGKAEFRIKMYDACKKYRGYETKATPNRISFTQGNFKYVLTIEDTDKLPELPDECLTDLNAVVKHLQTWVKKSNAIDLEKECYELYGNY